MTETQLRKLIRKQLIKEMAGMEPKQPEQDLTAMDYVKSAGTGAGIAAVALGINKLIMDIQTNGVGHDIALKLQHLSDMVQNAMKE
jgi:hypothetical protein